LALALCVTSYSTASGQARFLLQEEQAPGDRRGVSVQLEVGGEMLVRVDREIKRLPLTVNAELQYVEHLLTRAPEPTGLTRSLRKYDHASASIQVAESGHSINLSEDRRLLLAEIRDGRTSFSGIESPLTRKQWDLVHVVGNSLAVDRLLPGKEIAEGDSWDHDAEALGALLGMDHVAVCDVSSVMTGESHQQVQLRLAGTVHGTIDGAPTELQLRGAYLYHLEWKRITKFNLAVKEKRATSDIVPGLDVVAKVRLVIDPNAATTKMPAELVKRFTDPSSTLNRALLYDASEQGFRFQHDSAWYVTAEQSDLLSLRFLQDGDLTAHCNVTSLPARSKGRGTSLEEFEVDVRQSLEKNLHTVSAATQWTTPQGYECLGIVADGTVQDVPVQWRHYLVAAPDLPRVSLSVTIEQSQIQRFADAERQLIETLELLPNEAVKTASRKLGKRSRE